MSMRLGFHKHGKCWGWRPSRTLYYSGRMTWLAFWRFYLVLDRRLDPA